MNISFDKTLLYIIPYLIIVSIFYNSGYWSSFNIDIFQYYQAQDILKGITIPFLKFLSIIIFPNIVAILSLITWKPMQEPSSDSNVKEPIFTKNKAKKARQKRQLEESGFKKSEKITRKIINFIAALLAASYIIGVIALGIMLFSFLDDEFWFVKQYAYAYKNTLMNSLMGACLLPSIILPSFYAFTNKNSDIGHILRGAAIVFAISFTSFIANTKGKIDAAKIQYGYEFFYSNKDNQYGLKYLGRVDKLYFLLDDNNYISTENDSLEFSNLNFGVGIIIKSTEDKNDIGFGYFKTAYTSNPEKFTSTFQARQPTNE